jgi:signal transduction histidine kinase
LVALAVIGQGGTTTWAFIALLIVAFSTTERLPLRQALLAAGALLVAGIVYDAALDSSSAVSSVVSPLVIVGLPAAAGWLLRKSREQTAALGRLAAELAGQREQIREAAVLAERTRVARELHDVIAHTVGVMLVQAGAAERLLPPGHPAQAPVHAIRTTGKQAMGELRRVIGLLRTAGLEAPEPQPGLADLQALVERTRENAQIATFIDADLDVSAGEALTIYRTVQEALTNAQRHAHGASITVRVEKTGRRLTVSVENDAPTRAADASGPPGYGLLGLAERADLYGGSFAAGPDAGGGWHVRLELPMKSTAASEVASSA